MNIDKLHEIMAELDIPEKMLRDAFRDGGRSQGDYEESVEKYSTARDIVSESIWWYDTRQGSRFWYRVHFHLDNKGL